MVNIFPNDDSPTRSGMNGSLEIESQYELARLKCKFWLNGIQSGPFYPKFIFDVGFVCRDM